VVPELLGPIPLILESPLKKILVALAALALSLTAAFAQSITPTDPKVYSWPGATATGPVGGYLVFNAPTNFSIDAHVTGTVPSTCTFEIQASSDGVSWTTGAASLSGDVSCASATPLIYSIVAKPVLYVRVNIGTLTGADGTTRVLFNYTRGPSGMGNNTSIDGQTGAFTFGGSGVSHTGNVYTFNGGGGGITPAQLALVTAESFGAVGDWNGTTGTDNTTALQNAINSLQTANICGQVLLQAKSYKITGTLNITKSCVGIKGASQQGSAIISTSATADMIDVAGTSTAALVIANQLEDFTLFRTVAPTGTAAGLSLNFTNQAIVNSVDSANSVRNFYFHGTGSGGSGDIRNCTGQNTLGSGTYYGFYSDSADGTPNPSLRLHNNFYFNGTASATTYGFYSTGSSIKDLMSWNFETANASYGEYFNFVQGADAFGASDIHLYGPVNDSFKISSIVANGLVIGGNPGLEISGGESGSVFASGGKAIDIEASTMSTSIVGHQMWGNATYQIYLSAGSANNTIVGNTIMGFTGAHGIFVQGASNTNIISGNNLYGTAATDDIALAGAVTDSVIANNTIVGTTTTAISLSATSARTHGLETNGINVVGTPINNAGNNPTVFGTVYTVATLPSASLLGAGSQVTVSDGAGTPPTCTGGGSNYQIAVSNGTAWSCH